MLNTNFTARARTCVKCMYPYNDRFQDAVHDSDIQTATHCNTLRYDATCCNNDRFQAAVLHLFVYKKIWGGYD